MYLILNYLRNCQFEFRIWNRIFQRKEYKTTQQCKCWKLPLPLLQFPRRTRTRRFLQDSPTGDCNIRKGSHYFLVFRVEVRSQWHLAARCPCPPVILKNCGPCPPVPAISKVGLPGPVRGQQRASRGLNFNRNPVVLLVKKLKFKFSLKKFTDFGFFHLISFPAEPPMNNWK